MTHVEVIEPPQPVVTAEEVRTGLGIDAGDDVLDPLIEAATVVLDGPSGWLGRALGEQTIELQTDAFWWKLDLPYPPVTSLVSVKYLDTNGDEQTVDPAKVFNVTKTLFLRPGFAMPATYCRPDAIRVRYVAGYPIVDGKSTVPASIRRAIILGVRRQLTAGDNPSISGETVDGVGSVQYRISGDTFAALSDAESALLSPFRVMTV